MTLRFALLACLVSSAWAEHTITCVWHHAESGELLHSLVTISPPSEEEVYPLLRIRTTSEELTRPITGNTTVGEMQGRSLNVVVFEDEFAIMPEDLEELDARALDCLLQNLLLTAELPDESTHYNQPIAVNWRNDVISFDTAGYLVDAAGDALLTSVNRLLPADGQIIPQQSLPVVLDEREQGDVGADYVVWSKDEAVQQYKYTRLMLWREKQILFDIFEYHIPTHKTTYLTRRTIGSGPEGPVEFMRIAQGGLNAIVADHGSPEGTSSLRWALSLRHHTRNVRVSSEAYWQKLDDVHVALQAFAQLEDAHWPAPALVPDPD